MLTAVAVLLAGSAWAGWSTNWPAWSYPSAGTNHAGEVWAAVNERALAAGAAAPATNVWFDVQYTNLLNCKAKVAAILASYVDTNQATDGNYTNWFNLGSNAFPLLTREILAQRLYLPTNYLEFTPWSDLAGIGGNGSTNDNYGGLGHPYGWTNASTAAGGTNWAPGRTNVWFTTDYGWQGLKAIAGEMLWTLQGASYLTYSRRWGTVGPYANWASATASAESSYLHRTTFLGEAMMYSWGYGDTGSYFAELKAHQDLPYASGIPTNFGHGVQFYVKCVPWTGYSNIEWSDCGAAGVVSNSYGWQGELSETWNAAVTGSVFGVTNIFVPPWCTEPAIKATSIRGWKVSDRKVLLKWDGTNGFTYK